MATSKDAVTSDTEGQEKPVRKQLQKASISHAAGESLNSSTHAEQSTEQQAESIETDQSDIRDASSPAPGLRKKRSHEEIEGHDVDDRPAAHTRSQHTRKRSRDSTAEEHDLNNGRKVSGERRRDGSEGKANLEHDDEPEVPVDGRPGTPEQKGGKRGEEKVEALTSPKTKRSRLHSATAEEEVARAAVPSKEENASPKITEKDAVATEEPPDAEVAGKAALTTAAKPPEAKSPTLISPGSGFAHTSVASPFGSVASPKSPSSEQGQTSASAFAASGFGSLAETATSGFGALGKTSGGPAGGWATKPAKQPGSGASSDSPNGTDKPASTFGGALGQQSVFGASSGSAFGAGKSGFGGKLGGGGTFGGGGAFGGSGFGSLGGGASLSSFASGKPSPFASGSAKPSRTFGALVDEDEDEEGGEEDDGGESGLKSPLSQESDKQDERFFIQDHETGEEGEVIEYSCRAKLYNFAIVDEEKGKKEWKERGLGTVRLNTTRPASDENDEQAAKPKARLVMRADGSHRLILNTPVQKDIKFGAPNGGPPQGGYLLFMGAVDGKKSLEMLQLKIRQQFIVELYDKITELQEAM